MVKQDSAVAGPSAVFLTPGGPPVLLGRFATSAGGIVDAALDANSLNKAMLETSDTSLAGLVRTAETLLSRDRPASERPIAFVAIGFGSPSAVPWAPKWSKGDWDESKHPRWPEGTPDHAAGEFSPTSAGGSPSLPRPPNELAEEGARRVADRAAESAARRAGRAGFLELIRMGFWGGLRIVPLVDLPLIILDAIRAIDDMIGFARLHPDLMAADEFLRNGPYRLDDLCRGGGEYVSFANMGQFCKTDEIELEKKYDPAGDGWDYHHIVLQGGDNAVNFLPEQLHNTENIVRIPTFLHEKITAKYNSLVSNLDLPSMGLADLNIPNTNMRFQDWVQTQPYDVQFRIGVQVMRSFLILK